MAKIILSFLKGEVSYKHILYTMARYAAAIQHITYMRCLFVMLMRQIFLDRASLLLTDYVMAWKMTTLIRKMQYEIKNFCLSILQQLYKVLG